MTTSQHLPRRTSRTHTPLTGRTSRTGRTILTPRKWARRCMWDAVGLNCIVFGFLILAILWSGQVVQAIPSTK